MKLLYGKAKDVYYLSAKGLICFGWAIKKSGYKAPGFIAFYGGGWTYKNVVYVRIWRIMVAVKLPLKTISVVWTKDKKGTLKYFELHYPKNYILE